MASWDGPLPPLNSGKQKCVSMFGFHSVAFSVPFHSSPSSRPDEESKTFQGGELNTKESDMYT